MRATVKKNSDPRWAHYTRLTSFLGNTKLI